MKPAPFDFKRVMTIDDAVSALGGEAGSVQLISGGQSLMPILNQRLANVTTLVDISQLDSLREIAASDAHIDIGAGVTAASIEDGAVAGSVGRLLSEVASGIGYRAVRNRGTVGGGIAFADPAGDWPSVLLALNAQITVISSRGTRQVPVDSLLEQPFQTTLASDEIVTTIRVPVLSEDARWSYYKFSPTIG